MMTIAAESKQRIIRFSPDNLGSATFSVCERYRYSLRRKFIPPLLTCQIRWQIRWLNMIMLNGSKATHLRTDPTVTRQSKRAQVLGFQGLIVTNAFGWMDTDPENMKLAADPVGPLNDGYILREAEASCASGGLVIAGWGNHGKHQGRAARMRELLKGIPVYCLGVTKEGEPVHPLYQSYNQKPERWM